MHESNTKTTSAFSLLALLLAAAAFKEELSSVYLPFPHTTLLSVFVIVIVILSLMLVLYLVIDLKHGTILEKRLNTSKLKLVLDHVFLFLIILLIFFAIAEVIIYVLNLTLGYQQAFTLLSSVGLGMLLAIRTIIDKKQYRKYISTLSEKERLIKLQLASAENYLSTIYSEKLRADIKKDITRLEDELKRAVAEKIEDNGTIKQR